MNADAAVTPLDALTLINEFNSTGVRFLSGSPTRVGGVTHYVDVNGDGILSPRDVLGVIDDLNAAPLGPAAEGESAATVANVGGPLHTAAESPPPAIRPGVVTERALATGPASAQPVATASSWAQAVDATLPKLDFLRPSAPRESHRASPRYLKNAGTVDDVFADEAALGSLAAGLAE